MPPGNLKLPSGDLKARVTKALSEENGLELGRGVL